MREFHCRHPVFYTHHAAVFYWWGILQISVMISGVVKKKMEMLIGS
jgi:hypothetical protein